MYQIIYDFFTNQVFHQTSSQALMNGQFDLTIGNYSITTSVGSYLSHLCTITSMIALVIVGILFFRWIFRVCAGLINRF